MALRLHVWWETASGHGPRLWRIRRLTASSSPYWAAARTSANCQPSFCMCEAVARLAAVCSTLLLPVRHAFSSSSISQHCHDHVAHGLHHHAAIGAYHNIDRLLALPFLACLSRPTTRTIDRFSMQGIARCVNIYILVSSAAVVSPPSHRSQYLIH